LGKESSVTRYAPALLFLVSLGPLHSQQPNGSDSQIAANISDTAQEFQERTKRFTGKWSYPAGDVNSVLAVTRQQLLDDLPKEAKPLRAYVLQNFPASLKGIPANQKVDMKVCGPYLTGANNLLNSLANVSAYRLDLILDSSPTGALFELTPLAGEKLARASRGTITNLWRGVYNYTVTREGEKTITGTIDFVREKGNTLRCSFVHQGNSGPALPCDLLSEH
jgi:hypothetical protein